MLLNIMSQSVQPSQSVHNVNTEVVPRCWAAQDDMTFSPLTDKAPK